MNHTNLPDDATDSNIFTDARFPLTVGGCLFLGDHYLRNADRIQTLCQNAQVATPFDGMRPGEEAPLVTSQLSPGAGIDPSISVGANCFKTS